MASEYGNQPQSLVGIQSQDFITSSATNIFSVFLNDLVCGSIAGLSYIITAHPLDSVKVRMQLERRPNISLR
jgi:hypothetical protein